MKEISHWRTRRLPPPEDQQPASSYAPEEDEISLGEYWKILVKHRRMILLLFFIVFGAGTYFALSATVLYTATATVKIEPQNPQVTGLGELQPLELRTEYGYHQTQFALLASRPLAARVISELKLESNTAFTNAEVTSPNPVDHVKKWISRVLRFFTSFLTPLFRSKPSSEGLENLQPIGTARELPIELTVPAYLIDQYRSFLEVSPKTNTRLVNVNFTTPSPTLSQALANAHVEAFMRMSLESRFNLTQEARDFLEQKKGELKKKLEKAESTLNAFRRRHGVVSVEKGENIVVDRLVDLNKQLTSARAQRIETESLYRTVANRNNQDLAEIMNQGLVQQLKTNITKLEAEKTRLGTVFKPDHPRMQELNQQIAAARKALNNEIANVVRGIKSGYAAALAKEQGLQSEAEKQQNEALRLRELGVDYTILQEEVNANRVLYESLLKRLSETTVSNDLAVSNMQIAERAAKPLSPSGPNAPLFILASMFSGLLLGIGAAFLREFFDTTLGTPDEVWRSVGLGTLGVVPDLKFLDRPTYNGKNSGTAQLTNRRTAAKDLIISHSPLSIVYESYRTIRTSLLLSQAEKPPQVILLTSPSPGEGKTANSLNLAIALAQDGHSVLLVDGDMRKGCCHARLGLRNHRGLSNVLSGALSLDAAIQETQVGRLYLLSRGVTPPNPSELLGSRKMTGIMNELRQRFDFILIDSPPAIAISDAAILSVSADGVILVFNGQATSTGYAQKAVERLDMVRARLLGVILNSVNLDNPSYSYFRRYSAYYQFQEGDEFVGETHNDVLTDSEHDVAASSDIVEAGEEKSTNGTFDKGSAGEEENYRGINGQSAFTATDVNDGAQSFSAAEANRTRNFANRSDGLVPERLMNRMVEVLMESIGPVAPLVVRDHIASLGESHDAFPASRIEELVRRITPEILHGELRSRFQKRIAEEFREVWRS